MQIRYRVLVDHLHPEWCDRSVTGPSQTRARGRRTLLTSDLPWDRGLANARIAAEGMGRGSWGNRIQQPAGELWNRPWRSVDAPALARNANPSSKSLRHTDPAMETVHPQSTGATPGLLSAETPPTQLAKVAQFPGCSDQKGGIHELFVTRASVERMHRRIDSPVDSGGSSSSETDFNQGRTARL